MSDTVSSTILKSLKRHDIRYVFGLPAAQIGLVMDGASRDPYFRYATTRHEEAAGHMAHAIARLTDSMAMCFGTVGPGATNMIPGVAAAMADNMPLIALTPNNQARAIDPGRDLLQNADQPGLYSACTKWNASIRYPERAQELIERAIHLARSGRPGPVHLDVPCDIGTAPVVATAPLPPVNPIPRPAPSQQELDQLVDLLRGASRPVLVAGGGVVRSGAWEQFRGLVRHTGLPVCTTPNARGVIDAACPTHLGSSGVLGGDSVIQALAEADLIVAVGCKFSSWMPVNKPPYYPVPEHQKIVQVDIDGDQLGKSVPAHLGLVADARVFIELLTAAIPSPQAMNIDDRWLQGLLATKAEYRHKVDAIAAAKWVEGEKVLNAARVAREIAALLPEDAIVATDGGQVMEWSNTFIHPRDPQCYLFNPGMGHLGMGLPFVNAAKMVHPDRVAANITGDGAMGCTFQELETAARYGLNSVTFVLNDSHWGMYRPMGEQILDNPDFGTRLTDVDFAAAARAFGCHGERVDNLEALQPAYERALASGKPAVLDIPIGFTAHPMDGFWPTVVSHGMEIAPVDLG